MNMVSPLQILQIISSPTHSPQVLGPKAGEKFDPSSLNIRVRDTQRNSTLLKKSGGKGSLKALAKAWLNLDIQKGEHDSVVDAQTTMRLYKKVEKEWEKELGQR
jgi:hypothetical protein